MARSVMAAGAVGTTGTRTPREVTPAHAITGPGRPKAGTGGCDRAQLVAAARATRSADRHGSSRSAPWTGARSESGEGHRDAGRDLGVVLDEGDIGLDRPAVGQLGHAAEHPR